MPNEALRLLLFIIYNKYARNIGHFYDSNNFIPLDQDTTINDMVVIWL